MHTNYLYYALEILYDVHLNLQLIICSNLEVLEVKTWLLFQYRHETARKEKFKTVYVYLTLETNHTKL